MLIWNLTVKKSHLRLHMELHDNQECHYYVNYTTTTTHIGWNEYLLYILFYVYVMFTELEMKSGRIKKHDCRRWIVAAVPRVACRGRGASSTA